MDHGAGAIADHALQLEVFVKLQIELAPLHME